MLIGEFVLSQNPVLSVWVGLETFLPGKGSLGDLRPFLVGESKGEGVFGENLEGRVLGEILKSEDLDEEPELEQLPVLRGTAPLGDLNLRLSGFGDLGGELEGGGGFSPGLVSMSLISELLDQLVSVVG